MNSWLYLASNNYANATITYEIAKAGFIWRSFYKDRQPPGAIANVKKLAVGDTLYLGYRDQGIKKLLGRFRIGQPDKPLEASEVFCSAPEALIQRLQENGYGPDPILQQTVGIFVQEVEPVTGELLAIPHSRNAIVQLQANPIDVIVGEPPIFIASEAPAKPITGVTESDGVYVGIDVGGRIDKGFDLCVLTFSKGNLKNIEFKRCTYPCALPPTDVMRGLVAAGNFSELSRQTYESATKIADKLWSMIGNLILRGAFIDSPSGFSRNQAGHGRATEKVSYRGVTFQSTPSVIIRREHRGDWSWLVYGMVAYTALLYSGGNFSKEQWRDALTNGLYGSTRQLQALHVRECFPTATIAVLREDQERVTKAIIQQLLHIDKDRPEVKVVVDYLQKGVFAVKKRGPLYDSADALVAALSSLPYAAPEIYREVERMPQGNIRWRGNPGDDILEGRISVVEQKQ